MTDERHPRDHWMLRRKADWTLLCTIMGMVGTILFYGVRAVRAHSQWMDKATEAVGIIPQVQDHDKRLVVIEKTLSDMSEDVRYIRRHMK